MEASTTVDPLNEQLDKPLPRTWRPDNNGDTIYGTFLRLEEGPAQFGGQTPIVIVAERGSNEERSIWLFGNVIRNQFLKLKPQPGELIAVRYLGKRQAKNPQPGTSGEYNDWKVAVDRPAESTEVNWGGVTANAPVGSDEDIPF